MFPLVGLIGAGISAIGSAVGAAAADDPEKKKKDVTPVPSGMSQSQLSSEIKQTAGQIGGPPPGADRMPNPTPIPQSMMQPPPATGSGMGGSLPPPPTISMPGMPAPGGAMGQSDTDSLKRGF